MKNDSYFFEMKKSEMKNLITKAECEHWLEKDEILALLKLSEFDADILSAADRVRKKYVGDDIHLRGLIEFSNICKNNCCYCGIRRDNRNICRYRLNEGQILDLAKKAKDYGLKTVVLQSGEDLWFDTNRMCHLLEQIKKLDLAITLSIGEKSFAEYKAYRQAGADRYLLRIETTDKDLYHRLDPEMSWDNRKRCLDDLCELGYEVGSGIMVGLPEQSLESIVNDIIFFKQMDFDMLGIGPFIPHPDTPLRNEKGKALDLSLKVMAIARILLPNINIPATTAMEVLHPQGKIIALESGANVLMPNITSEADARNYTLYPGKEEAIVKGEYIFASLSEQLERIGRKIGVGYGSSLRYMERKSLDVDG